MQAANDRFDVDAWLKLPGEHRQGDLYAKRELGVGVELRGEAHKRYDGRPDLLT